MAADCSISADVLSELLEVAIHQILYSRELYPLCVFENKRKYNIPVKVCIHPGVDEYVRNVVAGVRPVLSVGQLKALQIAITDPSSGAVLEKFVFQITQVEKRPHQLKDDLELKQLEESLRALCLKLSVSDSLLGPLPPKCSFRVLLQVPLGAAPLLHNTKVRDTDSCVWVEASAGDGLVAAGRLVPLKSVNSELCKLQLYVEESQREAKAKNRKSSATT